MKIGKIIFILLIILIASHAQAKRKLDWTDITTWKYNAHSFEETPEKIICKFIRAKELKFSDLPTHTCMVSPNIRPGDYACIKKDSGVVILFPENSWQEYMIAGIYYSERGYHHVKIPVQNQVVFFKAPTKSINLKVVIYRLGEGEEPKVR
jgi:hypothetical protein